MKSQARHRRQYRRHNSPTLASSSPTASALRLPSTSEQLSAQRTAGARDSLTSISTTSSGNSNNNNNDVFIQQNPRYSSLWLQKCLLPRRLSPSTLTGGGPHHLSPDCYPYPNMADSVDRVFVHALHTVKRLPRTGSARPPERDRLALYGLYKQATEGDVAGLPRRTTGTGNGSGASSSSKKDEREQIEDAAERAKWEAWASHGGMGKTAAKRAYIEVLVRTMRMYAMGTVEARELVGELEFVWDQIREVGEGGSGSSGGGGGGGGVEGAKDRRRRRRRRDGSGVEDGGDEYGDGARPGGVGGGAGAGGLRVLRPMSEGDDIEINANVGAEEDEHDDDDDDEDDFRDPPEEISDTSADLVLKGAGAGGKAATAALTDFDVRNRKWRRGKNSKGTRAVELALGRLSVEIAALREQIERQGAGGILGKRRTTVGGILAWSRWLLAVSIRHLLVDGILLLLLVVWARRKGNRRLEQGLQLFYYWVREQVERVRVPDALKRAVMPL